MQPHLRIKKDRIAPYVLLPGDPGRVDLIGTRLDGFSILASNRAYRVGTGSYKGAPVTVCATGIGCPSAAIAIEELIADGARVLMRVGTCGGAWRDEIAAGSVVIPTACVRDEGTTKEYIPCGFPAVADYGVVQALACAAQTANAPFFIGISRTHDAFYGNDETALVWGSYLKDRRWQSADTPILSSDMETAALFVLASLWNVRAGAVLAVNADPEPLKRRVLGASLPVIAERDQETTQRSVNAAICIALEAIHRIHEKL